jgi:hypothetical protein
MVRNGECGAEQRDEGLTSRGVAWICKLISARPMLMDAGQSVEQMSFVAADSSRRIESLASPGRSCDRHDLRQLESQLYARLLLLDIAVLMREIPGLAVRRDDIRCGSKKMSMSLRRAMSARARPLISPSNEPYAEVRRCATLPTFLTPRLLLGVASNLGTLRRTTDRQC